MKIANKLTKLTFIAAAMLSFGMSNANATHIFFSPLTINGTALETSSGFTDPTITITAGQSVDFRSTITPAFSVADSFVLRFTRDADSTLATIPSTTIAFKATPSIPFSADYHYTFLTAGVFDGSVLADISGSNPDYKIPSNGSEVNTRNFAFQVNVLPATTVPEPTSIALLGLGLFGFAASRRKSAK